MGENGNAKSKYRKSRLRTLKTEYQFLRDVRSGRAKMQIRHEPPEPDPDEETDGDDENDSYDEES